jgi:hypothetical protein
MASEVDIANRALQKLGAERIVSLTQDNENARAVNACYDSVRDAELRSHPWNFAISRVQLAADSTAPSFGFATSYTLPSDCLRVLPPDPLYNYNSHDWQIEGRKILTNDSGALNVRYIKRETDPNQYDAIFIEALSCKLAVELCEQLTQSNTKAQIIRDDYIRAMREARRLNAFENVSAETFEDTWITARA